MKPDSNQRARLYGTAKTPKIKNLEDITVINLKFRPTIDQTRNFMYNVAKVISDYLRPLCKNKYSINDTQKFPWMLSSILKLQDSEEDVSYDVESLFTNIAIEETINCIIEQIYAYKKLTPLCLKLIFRKLMIKLVTECFLKFNSRSFKKMDGSSIEGPLSVTLSDIYMVKMESDVVIPSKSFIKDL